MEPATISLFVGSTREGRMAGIVSDWIRKGLEGRGHDVHMIDPNEYTSLQVLRVPNHYRQEPHEELGAISEKLEASDGFVLVTSEYNHSYSGALKNAIDMFMPEYKRKPFGIVSHSGSPFGGVRANEALRQVVSELKGVPTPIPLMISASQNVFDENGNLIDEAYVKRLDAFLDDFEWYVEALRRARS